MWQITYVSIIIYWVINTFKCCAQVRRCILIQLRFHGALHIRITLLYPYKLRRKHVFFLIFIPYKWSYFANLIWNNLWNNLISCHTIIECLIMIILLHNTIFITIRIYHWSRLLIFLIYNRYKLFFVLILLKHLHIHSFLLQVLQLLILVDLCI